MSQKRVLLYGRRLFARLLFHDAKNRSDFIIDSFVVDDQFFETDFFLGLPVYKFSEIERIKSPNNFDMIVCDASINIPNNKLYEKAKNKGYSLRNYISHHAIVHDTVILGDNNIIFEQAYIGPDVSIGNNNVIRHQVYIGHDGSLGNHNIINAGTKIGGNNHIGNGNYIGLNSTIIHNMTIGDESIIGAGSVVIRNIESYTKNVGNPSRKI